jgi:hypothetical protein
MSQAENFVDDTVALRIIRERAPEVDPSEHGLDSVAIRARHLVGLIPEPWATPLTDIAFRFADGSIARRLVENGRWEVYREW